MGDLIDLTEYRKGTWEDIWGAGTGDVAILFQHNSKTNEVRLETRKKGKPVNVLTVVPAKAIGLMMVLEEIFDNKNCGA